MAEVEAHVSGSDISTMEEEHGNEKQEDIQSQIKTAMQSRIDHCKNQASSLTFEGVRRLLEKDLQLEKYSLDAHKRFIKQCLLQALSVPGEETKTNGKSTEKEVISTSEFPDGQNKKGDVDEMGSEGQEKIEDSYKVEDSEIVGNHIGQKRVNSEAEECQNINEAAAPSESMIAKAILKRDSYIRANSDKVTMAGVRRLLEEDLKLETKALDPYKKFILKKVDEILEKSESSDSAKSKHGRPKKNSSSKATSEMITERNSDASEKESEFEEIVERGVKTKKKVVAKGKQSEGVRKRQRSSKEPNKPRKKQKNPIGEVSEKDADEGDDGNASNDDKTQSSDEKPTKKKEAAAPIYGKRVEHLKSVIKACGMSVSPAIYKRVKQAPENKREASLIKELEGVLSREGLSANPSEKEIKDVKKRKDRARELEGIDMSNIVSSSRRRSTTSYVSPPKPKIPVESDSDESEDSDTDDDNDSDEDEEEDGDNDGGEEDGDNDGGEEDGNSDGDEEDDNNGDEEDDNNGDEEDDNNGDEEDLN